MAYSANPNAITVVLGPYDKVLPLVSIGFGFVVGAISPFSNSPLLRRIMNLTPITQNFAAFSVSMAEPQKAMDKGWIERWSFSLSAISHTLIGYNSAVLCIGFAGFFVFLLFYGQYYKEDHRFFTGLG